MICLLALLTACQPDIHFVENSFQSSSAEVVSGGDNLSVLFTSEAGKATVVFESNKEWSVAFVNDRAKDWCSFSEESGRRGTYTLTVGVNRNDSYDERSASILLTCKDITRTIVVTQKQRDALLMTAGRVEIPQTGGSFQIEVQANIDYTAAVDGDCDWIHPVGTKGLKTTVNAYMVDANETIDSRQGYVVVSSSLGKESVTVYQPGEEPTLVLGTHEVLLPAEEAAFSLQVTSNLNVSFAIRDESWLQEVSTKTISTNTFYFTATPNKERKERVNTIVFRDAARGMADSVRIRQACFPVLSSVDPFVIPTQSVDIRLQTIGGKPDDFSVASSVSWLSLSRMEEGEEGCGMVIHSSVNRSGKSRSGVIRVSRRDFDTYDEVSVTQLFLPSSFSVATKKQAVKAPHFAQSGEAFILWGDGSFDYFPKYSGKIKEMAHSYSDGKSHTITVESESILWLQVAEPDNDMQFDFSHLKTKE